MNAVYIYIDVYICNPIFIVDDPNVCDPPCQNGGSCVNNVCRCSWNYIGRLCETCELLVCVGLYTPVCH